MSRVDTWMPLYIGDYLADTMHLTAEEHGAYLLLIMQYFRNGPLRADDGDLARMAKVDPEVWNATVGPRVRAFFRLRNGKLHHKRIDAERRRAENLSKKRAISGQKGGQAKAAKPKQNQQLNGTCHEFATILPEQKATPLPSQVQEERKKEERGERGRAPGRAGARPRTMAPDEWKPSDDLIALGVSLGFDLLDIDRKAERMRDWSRANGKRYVDWDAAFRNWLRKDAEAPPRIGRRDDDPIGQLRRDWNLPTFLAPVLDDDEAAPLRMLQ